MIESHSEPFVFRGKPARMSVIRNNAACWGRIRFDDNSPELDVEPRRDWYESDDYEAIAAFIRMARNGRRVGPALGWTK